jgi:hypothetical protein
MGHTAILIRAAALGIALICLFAGYLWGRSNVRSQIEDALDKVRVSADAREFALREQLDDKMFELGELRARADEAQVLKEQLAQLQSSHLQDSHDPHSRFELPEQPAEIIPEHSHKVGSIAAVADNLIQSFSHTREEMPQPLSINHDAPFETKRPPAARFPASFSSTFTATEASPEPVKPKPVQPARPAAVQPAKVQPAQPTRPPAVKPVAAVNNDDWDEFAKSLEALKNLQK